jgi:hypothetical protein
VIIVIERSAGVNAFELLFDRRIVGEENIRPAVSIVIDEDDSTAHGFDDVFLFGNVRVLKLDSTLGGNVDELRDGPAGAD